MKYLVPVCVEYLGTMTVEASSPEEAIKIARKNYFATNTGIDLLEDPDVEIDFAMGDDPEEVERFTREFS